MPVSISPAAHTKRNKPLSRGFVEIAFLSVTLVVADRIVKSSGVNLLGLEVVGNECLLIKIEGEHSSVRVALETAAQVAEELGSKALIHAINQSGEGFDSLIKYPNAISPLYGGPDQFLPHSKIKNGENDMNASLQAIGILETQGLAASLEAADAMLKAGNVTLVGKEKIGAAYVTIIIQGDVAAVQSSIAAGREAVGHLGKLIAAHVISRPHPDMISLLPK